MREKLKRYYYRMRRLFGRDAELFETIKREKHIVVLNFHQVSPDLNPFWPALHPDHFDELLTFLKERFHIVRFDELSRCKPDKPRAILSFDDGYYDFMEYAVPILSKHRLPANLNIIPSCVESGLPIWNVRLYDFLDSAPRSLINQLRIPHYNGYLKSESAENKLKFGLGLSRFLKNRSHIERGEIWSHIEKVIEQSETKSTRMLREDDVKQIANDHELGVHSFSHDSMEFEDDPYFCDDLRKCFDYFRTRLELPLKIYAFPNGSYRARQVQILTENGIEYVLLVNEDYADDQSRVLPRFTIYGRSSIEAQFQALGINRKK